MVLSPWNPEIWFEMNFVDSFGNEKRLILITPIGYTVMGDDGGYFFKSRVIINSQAQTDYEELSTYLRELILSHYSKSELGWFKLIKNGDDGTLYIVWTLAESNKETA